MTIKHLGGIFGRNPTFNDVTSASATTNDLTVNANGAGITISGNNTSSGSKNNLRFVDTDASVASGQQVGRIEFYTSDAGNEGINAYIEGRDGSSSGSGSIVLGTGNSGAAVDRLELVSGGNLNLLTGNLVIGTSGKGIDFSATSGTGTSELFDDYEEGTWTPTFTTDGTDFDSVTYDAITSGKYIKIGLMVYVQFLMRTDAITVGSASGNVVIGGLPFTSSTGTQADRAGIFSIGQTSSWAGDVPFSAEIKANTTQANLYYRTSVNGNTTNIAVADLGIGSNDNLISCSGSYISS